MTVPRASDANDDSDGRDDSDVGGAVGKPESGHRPVDAGTRTGSADRPVRIRDHDSGRNPISRVSSASES